MEKKCSKCGYVVQDEKIERCPRCYAIIPKFSKCSDCDHCSLFKTKCDKE